VIGNFGGRARHNYTASGDAVNAASRLEALNKHFTAHRLPQEIRPGAVWISVSGSTRELCNGMAFRPMAMVVLKGKTQAIEVWEPLHEEARNDGYIERYCEAYAKLKAGAAEAKALFEALAQENPHDPAVEYHLTRIHTGKEFVDKMEEK
jgi:adenylate cyclase